VENYKGIEFISLRRFIDRNIIDGNYTNSIEAEKSWQMLVDKWVPSMKEMLCNFTLRAKALGESSEEEEEEEEKREIIISPTNLISPVKDKVMEGSNRVLSRDIVSTANTIDPKEIKEEEEGECPTLETLKQQYIENVREEIEESVKEGYAYDEEKVQEEIEEFMMGLDLDDKIHKELERKMNQRKEEPKEMDNKLQVFPNEWKNG
jgi:hypothetical protein